MLLDLDCGDQGMWCLRRAEKVAAAAGESRLISRAGASRSCRRLRFCCSLHRLTLKGNCANIWHSLKDVICLKWKSAGGGVGESRALAFTGPIGCPDTVGGGEGLAVSTSMAQGRANQGSNNIGSAGSTFGVWRSPENGYV